jgi:flagellar basal body rod protein FlgG
LFPSQGEVLSTFRPHNLTAAVLEFRRNSRVRLRYRFCTTSLFFLWHRLCLEGEFEERRSVLTKDGCTMLNGLYSAAGAIGLASRNHEIVAENLANVTTTGYRRHGLVFDALADNLGNLTASAPTSVGRAAPPTSFTHFDPGPLQQTNNPFDLAIDGNAFFVLDGPNGPVYTRNGAFEMNSAGQLQARGSRYLVQGSGGALTIPANVSRVAVGADGTVSAEGASLGQIRLASFQQPQTLRRVGATLFEGDNPQAPDFGNVRVQQGYREGSNVQAFQEMISMMLGMRYYEAAEKAMRTISESVALNTRPQQ